MKRIEIAIPYLQKLVNKVELFAVDTTFSFLAFNTSTINALVIASNNLPTNLIMLLSSRFRGNVIDDFAKIQIWNISSF